jgi:hypothetical protein
VRLSEWERTWRGLVTVLSHDDQHADAQATVPEEPRKAHRRIVGVGSDLILAMVMLQVDFTNPRATPRGIVPRQLLTRPPHLLAALWAHYALEVLG